MKNNTPPWNKDSLYWGSLLAKFPNEEILKNETYAEFLSRIEKIAESI